MMPHIPRSAFHFVNCPLDSWYYFVKLHSFTIRQYRILPCRFLQCIPHGKPPCVVLILPISFRAYKGLAPSGKKTPAQSFVLTKNSCIFEFFLLLCSRCALLMQGTHIRYISGGREAQLERFAIPIKFVMAERKAIPNAARNIPSPLATTLKKQRYAKNELLKCWKR